MHRFSYKINVFSNKLTTKPAHFSKFYSKSFRAKNYTSNYNRGCSSKEGTNFGQIFSMKLEDFFEYTVEGEKLNLETFQFEFVFMDASEKK